jgi:hypothetical protein
MTAIRMQFLTIALIILVGIFLTGFGEVHWFLYVPVVMFAFAGVTGVCPGMTMWKKLGFE